MSKSRLTTGVYAFTAACLLATWAYSQSPKPQPKNADKTEPNPFSALGGPFQSADPNTLPQAPTVPKPAKSARILFESNWKNVQVGSKPMYFQQGMHSYIWTIKNTGDTAVDLGDDYGFSIEPGDEDFIVGTRVMLSVAGEKTTTVEVKAARVMTQSELTSGVHTTVPGTPYGPVGGSPINGIPAPNAPAHGSSVPSNGNVPRRAEDKDSKPAATDSFKSL